MACSVPHGLYCCTEREAFTAAVVACASATRCYLCPWSPPTAPRSPPASPGAASWPLSAGSLETEEAWSDGCRRQHGKGREGESECYNCLACHVGYLIQCLNICDSYDTISKFGDPVMHFASLGTRMTKSYKFEDRQCTLLFYLIIIPAWISCCFSSPKLS
jgi:hypothetical protein